MVFEPIGMGPIVMVRVPRSVGGKPMATTEKSVCEKVKVRVEETGPSVGNRGSLVAIMILLAIDA